jgi:hypothetical protein
MSELLRTIVSDQPLWTADQVAEFLDLPVSTVKRWRRIRDLMTQIEGCDEGSPGAGAREALQAKLDRIEGVKLKGPKFMKIGARKVRYRRQDVIDWAMEPT